MAFLASKHFFFIIVFSHSSWLDWIQEFICTFFGLILLHIRAEMQQISSSDFAPRCACGDASGWVTRLPAEHCSSAWVTSAFKILHHQPARRLVSTDLTLCFSLCHTPPPQNFAWCLIRVINDIYFLNLLSCKGLTFIIIFAAFRTRLLFLVILG